MSAVTGLRAVRALLTIEVVVGAIACAACGQRASSAAPGAQSSLVHLADQLDRAVVQGAAAPDSSRATRLWRFDEPRPEWRAISTQDAEWLAAPVLEQHSDCLRFTLAKADGPGSAALAAGLAIDLEPSPLAEWDGVLVSARSHERTGGMMLTYNLVGEEEIPGSFFFMDVEEACPIFDDGSAQTYMLPLQARPGDATLDDLALFIGAPGPSSIEILSIELVPRGRDYLADHGVRSVTRDTVTRHTLFAHTPAAFTWRVTVPEGGRLDVGLACLPGEAVSYRVTVGPPGGERRVLLETRVEDDRTWRQVSADLAPWAGAEIELALEATSERPAAVALWGAPLVSGGRASAGPNVIFYVIDGGGADLMSLYRYNRRTTPFLEELAREGVTFERAYSNSTWTQASTASFMTSLHHSVLGGLRRGIHSTPVPTSAVTMAEHMRHGGYQTAVFTSNPNAARVIGLERGVDWMEDAESEYSTSSAELHEWFWAFREVYPGQPYWVHFQTTDVHEPNESVPPFAGLFVSSEDRARLAQWEDRLFDAAGEVFGTTSIVDFYDRALAAAGIDRSAYFNTRRGLYDETMAHQDEQLRRLVERLRARGEWENTLLVIAADHGHPAGTFARFGRGLFEPQPEGWQGALFDSYSTRIPLLFVWPARIAGGRVIREPASMIDVLPTILDLAGLPPAEVAQGRSLAPLLRSEGGEGTPSGTGEVLFDEFRVDEATGELVGNLEIIDGRWGASLEIGPLPEGSDPTKGRHAVPAGGRWGAVHPFFPEAPRLLLYDLWNDPFARRAVNDEHPELVEHYRSLLLERWQAQLALASRFSAAESEPLDPAQLEQLRELGYIR